jgi:hypothetical protein
MTQNGRKRAWQKWAEEGMAKNKKIAGREHGKKRREKNKLIRLHTCTLQYTWKVTSNELPVDPLIHRQRGGEGGVYLERGGGGGLAHETGGGGTQVKSQFSEGWPPRRAGDKFRH